MLSPARYLASIRTLRFEALVRAFVVILVLANLMEELSSLGLRASPAGWLLMLVTTGASLTSLFRPTVGYLISLALMGAGALWVPELHWYTPWLIGLVTVTVYASPTLAVVLLGASVTELGGLQLLTGAGYLVDGSLVMIVFVGAGLTIRLLGNRRRAAIHQIATLRRSVAEVRQDERRLLARELSEQLSDAFRTTNSTLEEAGLSTDPDAARSLLRAVTIQARGSLGRLRGLVGNLRGGTEDTATDETHMSAVLDDIGDELIPNAFVVETAVTGQGALSPREAHALRSFARFAMGQILIGGTAGADVQAELAFEDGQASLRVSLDQAAAGPDGDAVAAARAVLSSAGGRLIVGEHLDGWEIVATVPSRGHAVEPDGGRPLERERDPAVDLTLTRITRWLRWVAIAGLLWAFWSIVGGDDRTEYALVAAACTVLMLATWNLSAAAATAALSLICAALLLEGTDVPSAAFFALYLLTVALAVQVLPRIMLPASLLLALSVSFVPTLGGFPGIQLAFNVIPAILLGLGFRYFLHSRQDDHEAITHLEHERETARLQERQDLAHELHDIVAHQLTAMTLRIDTLPATASLDELRATTHLVQELHDAAEADLRTLLALMREDAPRAPDAAAAAAPSEVARSVLDTLVAADHPTNLVITGDIDAVDATTRRTATRILREAATNILRYATPGGPCSITLSNDHQVLRLRIINPIPNLPLHHPDSTGTGLVSMTERVSLTGGTLTATELWGNWTLEALIPHTVSTSRDQVTS